MTLARIFPVNMPQPGDAVRGYVGLCQFRAVFVGFWPVAVERLVRDESIWNHIVCEPGSFDFFKPLGADFLRFRLVYPRAQHFKKWDSKRGLSAFGETYCGKSGLTVLMYLSESRSLIRSCSTDFISWQLPFSKIRRKRTIPLICQTWCANDVEVGRTDNYALSFTVLST